MPTQNLRLLSLDGGGVRGLSSLFILQRLMLNINPDNPPRPCDYFDMIAGTSTGGLIAIMLGRLQMSVDECIDEYTKLASEVFQKKHYSPARLSLSRSLHKTQARFDTKVLEDQICGVLRRHFVKEGDSADESARKSREELLKDTRPMSCKVFVVATSKGSAAPAILSSYPPTRVGHDLYKSATIWQAARATSAASTFFDPIKIGPQKQEFLDGGTGANNPIEYVWNEAQSALCASDSLLEENLDCIISVGTGVSEYEPFGDDLKGLGKALLKIATQTKETARLFHTRHSKLAQGDKYFRFDVPNGLGNIGLEQAGEVPRIKDLTDTYLSDEDVFGKLKRAARALKEPRNSVPNDPAEEQQQSLQVRKVDGRFPGDEKALAIWLEKLDLKLSKKNTKEHSTENLLDRMSTYDVYRTFARISRRKWPGTTLWVAKEAKFIDWLSSDESVYLWLCGKVGSGKTTTMTTIVSEAIERTQSPVLNFFFEYPYNNAVHLMSSLAQQLLRHCYLRTKFLPSKARLSLQQLYSHDGRKPNLQELQDDIFQPLLSEFPGCCIIIDGIDECEARESERIVQLLRKLQTEVFVKILISTREDTNANVSENALYLDGNATYSPLQKSDIEVYVDEQLDQKSQKGELLEDDNLRFEVRSELLLKARGMFLWVRLQLQTLFEECLTPADVRQALGRFPEGLNEIYWRCLTRASGLEARYTPKILQWVCVAPEPLHIDHLRELLAFDPEERTFDPDDMPSGAAVLRAATNLISLELDGLSEDERCLMLVHPTVRDFVFSSLAQDTLALMSGTTDFEQRKRPESTMSLSSTHLGMVCITYLLTFSGRELERQRQVTALVNIKALEAPMIPLAKKVTAFTRSHIMQDRSASPKARLHARLAPKRSGGALEVRLVDYARRNWHECIRSTSVHDMNFQILRKDLEALVLNKNDTSALPWFTRGRSGMGRLQAAFWWAIAKEHVPLLHFVIETQWKEEVFLQDGFFDMPVDDYGGFPPLNLACNIGNTGIVSVLVDHCGLLSRSPKTGRTALHEAATAGESIIRLLLDTDAERTSSKRLLDRRDYTDSTPLHLAAKFGTRSACATLVEWADSHWLEVEKGLNLALNLYGKTPLDYALERGDSGVVLELLDRASVDEIIVSIGKRTQLGESFLDFFCLPDSPSGADEVLEMFAESTNREIIATWAVALLLFLAVQSDDSDGARFQDLINMLAGMTPAEGLAIDHLYGWARGQETRLRLLYQFSIHRTCNFGGLLGGDWLNFVGKAVISEDQITLDMLFSLDGALFSAPVGVANRSAIRRLQTLSRCPQLATIALRSPLLFASYLGNLEIVKSCEYAQLESFETHNLQSIHVAATAGYSEITDYLREAKSGRSDFYETAGDLVTVVLTFKARWGVVVFPNSNEASIESVISNVVPIERSASGDFGSSWSSGEASTEHNNAKIAPRICSAPGLVTYRDAHGDTIISIDVRIVNGQYARFDVLHGSSVSPTIVQHDDDAGATFDTRIFDRRGSSIWHCGPLGKLHNLSYLTENAFTDERNRWFSESLSLIPHYIHPEYPSIQDNLPSSVGAIPTHRELDYKTPPSQSISTERLHNSPVSTQGSVPRSLIVPPYSLSLGSSRPPSFISFMEDDSTDVQNNPIFLHPWYVSKRND